MLSLNFSFAQHRFQVFAHLLCRNTGKFNVMPQWQM